MNKTGKHKLRFFVLVLILCLCFAGIKLNITRGRIMENAILKIREQIKPLDFNNRQQYPELVTDYFKYYNLDLAEENIEHIFGTFESNGYTLAAHIFKPAEYKATVVTLHGYLNHCGELKHLIKYLLDEGYAVAAYDSPGHGLSSGHRAAIDDFSQYSGVLTDFTNVLAEYLHGPYHFIGFSTGSTAAIDYLLTGQNTFDKVILAAPLVHSCAWKQSKATFKYYSKFTDFVPRWPRNNSHDKEFILFNRKKDYLHAQWVPLKWVKALYEWNDKIEDLPPSNKTIKVIQGTNDTTVDAGFNMKFIRQKFPNADIKMIKNARHELFNEAAELRNNVFSQIKKYLEGE
jgi:alpha-beta hydrolase superfamily lysophospholipase